MTLRSLDTGQRRVRCLEPLEIDGWRLKLYGMSLQPEPAPSPLLDQARERIRATLPRPAVTDERFGVGFATLHTGTSGTYLLLDWWVAGGILQHHLFGAPHGDPRGSERLEYGWPRGAACCVWEMAVLWFERNAWCRHVLAHPESPDLDAYLDDRLEGSV